MLTMESMNKRFVRLVVADPWDLVDGSGRNFLTGTVDQARRATTESERDLISLTLATPITYRGTEYDRVVCEARSGTPIFDALMGNENVEVSVYGLPTAARVGDIAPRAWWRGGLSATATASLM